MKNNPHYGDTDWCQDQEEVQWLAEKLVDDGTIVKSRDILYFFEKPWKWSQEYRDRKAGPKPECGCWPSECTCEEDREESPDAVEVAATT